MRDADKTKAQLIQEIESLRQQLSALQPNPTASPDPSLENVPEPPLRSEERFYHVFRTSPVGISLSVPEDGSIVGANDSFLALLGWTRSDLIGKTAFELEMWSDREQRRRVMKDLLANGSVRDLELHYVTRQGEVRHVLVSFDLLELEGKIYVLGFHVDITQRKRAEEDLQRQLTENARLLEQANSRAREMGALIQLSSALRQAFQPNQMILTIISEAKTAMSASSAAILLPAGSSMQLTRLCPNGEIQQHEIPPQEQCDRLWRVINQGDPLYLTSRDNLASSCFIVRNLMDGMAAAGFAPLKAAGTVLGLLYVAFREDGKLPELNEYFPENLRLLLEAISDLGGNSLQRAITMELLEKRFTERSAYLSTLYEVTSIASNPEELKTMLELVLDKVLRAMSCPAGIIFLQDAGEDLSSFRLFVSQGLRKADRNRSSLISTSASMWGRDIRQAKRPLHLDLHNKPEFFDQKFLEPFSTLTGAPIRAKGEMTGMLCILGQTEHRYTREDMVQLMAIADQIGVIVENDRLRKKAEQAAITEERQRLSRELHDSVNQLLYSLALFARGGLNYVQGSQWSQVARSLEDINETAQQALKEMRLMLFEMRPDSLQQAGLVEALRYRLEAVERRAGVNAQLVVDGSIDLPPEVENELYRVAQEALNNALKHAFAKKVTVHLFLSADHKVKLEIMDDGYGFDPSATSGGMGLSTMRERMVRLGGILSITSVKGQGTRVVAELNSNPPTVGIGRGE